MNFLDILILFPIAWFGFKGLKNGLISELFSIVALLLGTWATFEFSSVVASWFGDGRLAKFLAFVLLFFGVLVLVHFVGKLVEKLVTLVIPDIVNHLFGLLFGAFKVLCVFSILFYAINSLDKHQIFFKAKIKEESLLYKYVEPITGKFLEWRELQELKSQTNEECKEEDHEGDH